MTPTPVHPIHRCFSRLDFYEPDIAIGNVSGPVKNLSICPLSCYFSTHKPQQPVPPSGIIRADAGSEPLRLSQNCQQLASHRFSNVNGSQLYRRVETENAKKGFLHIRDALARSLCL